MSMLISFNFTPEAQLIELLLLHFEPFRIFCMNVWLRFFTGLLAIWTDWIYPPFIIFRWQNLFLQMQVVRSRLQEQGHHSEKRYSGVVDCIKKVLQQEGLAGFYRGCATNLLRTTPAAVITFTSFEMIHRFLVNLLPPDPHPHTLWIWAKLEKSIWCWWSNMH